MGRRARHRGGTVPARRESRAVCLRAGCRRRSPSRATSSRRGRSGRPHPSCPGRARPICRRSAVPSRSSFRGSRFNSRPGIDEPETLRPEHTVLRRRTPSACGRGAGMMLAAELWISFPVHGLADDEWPPAPEQAPMANAAACRSDPFPVSGMRTTMTLADVALSARIAGRMMPKSTPSTNRRSGPAALPGPPTGSAKAARTSGPCPSSRWPRTRWSPRSG